MTRPKRLESENPLPGALSAPSERPRRAPATESEANVIGVGVALRGEGDARRVAGLASSALCKTTHTGP
jgi:hypothetical protein